MRKALLCLALAALPPIESVAAQPPCATPETWGRLTGNVGPLPAAGADCSNSSTTPGTQYLPAKLWHLPIVVHVIMDNASSHKTKLIRRWFAKRPHWHVHFTPTSSSWINQVERFFTLLSEQQIKRGAHRSVVELEAAITAYIKLRNTEPKPFRWTKSADDILASIARFCRRTLDTQAKCA